MGGRRPPSLTNNRPRSTTEPIERFKGAEVQNQNQRKKASAKGPIFVFMMPPGVDSSLATFLLQLFPYVMGIISLEIFN